VLGSARLSSHFEHFAREVMRRYIACAEAEGHAVGTAAWRVCSAKIGRIGWGSQLILKGMYDVFTSDLESKNADQAMKQKQHEELSATRVA